MIFGCPKLRCLLPRFAYSKWGNGWSSIGVNWKLHLWRETIIHPHAMSAWDESTSDPGPFWWYDQRKNSPTNFGDQKTHPFHGARIAFFSFLLAYFSWWSNYVEFTSVFVAMVYYPHFGVSDPPSMTCWWCRHSWRRPKASCRQKRLGGNSFWTGWMKLFRL